MSKYYPHRFKTEAEFHEEFGENWRSIVGWNSSGNMDYLLGEVLKVVDSSDIFPYGSIYYGTWAISKNMLVEIPRVPNYKPRKIIRE